MPRVSIIVPVYNVEQYLSRCLDSLINQTLEDIEIICVNDGSKDNSLKILNDYAGRDSRIKIINQENKGLSVARNNGYDASCGEFISFIDSDDWISENFFEKLYESAIKTNSDIAAGSIICSRKNKEEKILVYENEEVFENYEKKLDICDVPTYCYVWNKIYKKDLLEKTGIRFAAGIIYEDVIFTPEILYHCGKLVIVPDVYYYYFRHKNTVVKRKNQKSKKDYIYAQNYMNNFLKMHNVDINSIGTQVKKYKIFGITIFKTIKKRNIIEYILFNIIKYKRKNNS